MREVVEETGVQAVVLGEPGFARTAVQGHASEEPASEKACVKALINLLEFPVAL